MGFIVKAMVLAGIRKAAILERPVPALQQTAEVWINTIRAGICGSDTHYYTQSRIGDRAVHSPYGHECCAVAADAGQHCRRQDVLFTILRSGL
ncbi:MAG: alcohol dehydrogenase catalytic domain-containing protein [Acidobacteria bacterium]|nr:alcohol dehydrogenase catalytic domain-containing protein [Acidobacteriota bacterium]